MRRREPLRILLAACAVLLVLPASARPVQGAECASPRKAVDTLLWWQQPEHADAKKAADCLDRSSGLGEPVIERRARQIKDVLDARGLYVKLADVPDDPAYTGKDGRARYVLFPREAPDLYVVRSGSRWLWSAQTVAAAPELYRRIFPIDLGGLERHLPAWTRGTVLGLAVWQLLGLLLFIVIGLVVRLVAMLLVARWARRLMRRFKAPWGEEILARIDQPVGALAAAATIALLLPGLHLPIRLSQVAIIALRVLAAFSAVWVAYRLVDLVSGWLRSKAERTETKLDDQLVPLVRTALKVFTVALGVVFVLQNLDVDVGSLLAGLGLGGLAFALAARDTVANLFGAVTIFLDRPFQIGDWIVVGKTEGIVERVGFRSTRVRTFYNSLVAVPNSVVATSVVDNYGKRQYRRTTVTLGVTYDTRPEQLQAFVEGIRAIIQAHPKTRKDYYEVHFHGFGDSSLEVMVYFFFEVATWTEELQGRHQVFMEILRLAEDLNVSFAFPTRTLHVDTLASATEVALRTAPGGLPEVVAAYGPGGARSKPGGAPLTSGYFATPATAGPETDDPSGTD